jgi:hypothetical protein
MEQMLYFLIGITLGGFCVYLPFSTKEKNELLRLHSLIHERDNKLEELQEELHGIYKSAAKDTIEIYEKGVATGMQATVGISKEELERENDVYVIDDETAYELERSRKGENHDEEEEEFDPEIMDRWYMKN